ncbi:MAG: alpha-ketoacid dehydrogenase subunit beta [Gammaproteobacteria bacterium]
MREVTFLQAVAEAQAEEMARDDSVFLMGEDVSGNVYGSSGGLLDQFGAERVLDTPICESGFTGVAIGAAMVGMRPIVDYTIASFMYLATDQLVSMAAKSSYMYGGQTHIPAVFRAAMFYNGGIAAQHSDRNYSMYMNVPGLKVVVPSSPFDAKGLLKTAIRDDDPVLVFEDGNLWGRRGEVPEDEYLLPFGQANILTEGSDVTLVAIAARVGEAVKAATRLAEEGISVEVIDPRTLVPLDSGTILESVAKTGRLLVVDQGHRTCGAAGEIAALVAEQGFWDLQAPIKRLTAPDMQIPFSPALEKGFYPEVEQIVTATRALMEE